jgi:hypothetical protein
MGLLRKLFGPSKNEVWTQLAREIEADFVPGGLWRGSKVEAHVGDWTVTLDTYTVSDGHGSIEYTRMRAPYVNRDGFRFKIYRSGFFTGLGKLFGMQDIEIGYHDFDEAFVVKSNDEGRVKTLLRSERLRGLLQDQPKVCLWVRDDEGWFGAHFPDGVDELCFQVVGVIKDIERLKGLYELFAETLNRLCAIGSAYERDPQVKLK